MLKHITHMVAERRHHATTRSYAALSSVMQPDVDADHKGEPSVLHSDQCVVAAALPAAAGITPSHYAASASVILRDKHGVKCQVALCAPPPCMLSDVDAGTLLVSEVMLGLERDTSVLFLCDVDCLDIEPGCWTALQEVVQGHAAHSYSLVVVVAVGYRVPNWLCAAAEFHIPLSPTPVVWGVGSQRPPLCVDESAGPCDGGDSSSGGAAGSGGGGGSAQVGCVAAGALRVRVVHSCLAAARVREELAEKCMGKMRSPPVVLPYDSGVEAALCSRQQRMVFPFHGAETEPVGSMLQLMMTQGLYIGEPVVATLTQDGLPRGLLCTVRNITTDPGHTCETRSRRAHTRVLVEVERSDTGAVCTVGCCELVLRKPIRQVVDTHQVRWMHGVPLLPAWALPVKVVAGLPLTCPEVEFQLSRAMPCGAAGACVTTQLPPLCHQRLWDHTSRCAKRLGIQAPPAEVARQRAARRALRRSQKRSARDAFGVEGRPSGVCRSNDGQVLQDCDDCEK